MKKELLIISLIILILLFNMKVKAASVIDGTYTRGVQITTAQNNSVILSYTTTSTTVTFPQSFNNINDDYIMIPIMGQAYFQLDNTAPGQYISIFPEFTQYIRVAIQSNWNRRNCEIANGYITCPIEKNSSFTKLYFETDIPDKWTDGYWTFNITIPTYADVYKKDNSAIIDNQNQNTQSIINNNTSYEGINQSEEINGSEELTTYQQEEQNLLDSLNMTEVENLDITINPNASTFIWTVIESLRTISSKIVVLMTSILGLGVIKLLLNR